MVTPLLTIVSMPMVSVEFFQDGAPTAFSRAELTECTFRQSKSVEGLSSMEAVAKAVVLQSAVVTPQGSSRWFTMLSSKPQHCAPPCACCCAPYTPSQCAAVPAPPQLARPIRRLTRSCCHTRRNPKTRQM